jgi:hypothetical protein
MFRRNFCGFFDSIIVYHQNWREMGCPALGVWVAFFKQPALPGEAPPQKKFNKKSQMDQK